MVRSLGGFRITTQHNLINHVIHVDHLYTLMMQTCDLINDVTPEENMDPSTLLLYGAFHFVRTQLGVGMGGGGSSLLYISIAYYRQKGGGWVQIACKVANVLNGRPLLKNCILQIETLWVVEN